MGVGVGVGSRIKTAVLVVVLDIGGVQVVVLVVVSAHRTMLHLYATTEYATECDLAAEAQM